MSGDRRRGTRVGDFLRPHRKEPRQPSGSRQRKLWSHLPSTCSGLNFFQSGPMTLCKDATLPCNPPNLRAARDVMDRIGNRAAPFSVGSANHPRDPAGFNRFVSCSVIAAVFNLEQEKRYAPDRAELPK